jgi:hypothetical protein
MVTELIVFLYNCPIGIAETKRVTTMNNYIE